MGEKSTTPQATLAGAKTTLPQHVVHRSFPSETVVLNLKTGKYHGLNPSAGAMLEALEETGSVGAAAAAVAARYGQPPEQIERDIEVLCRALAARDLIVLEDGGED